MQYSRRPVTSPFTTPRFFSETRLMRSDNPRRVPATEPTAKLRMNRTGYSLLAILGKAALAPSTKQHRPKPLNRAFLYFSPIPVRSRAPKAPPTSMVAVFTMVPNIILSNCLYLSVFFYRTQRHGDAEGIPCPSPCPCVSAFTQSSTTIVRSPDYRLSPKSLLNFATNFSCQSPMGFRRPKKKRSTSGSSSHCRPPMR